MGAAMKGVRPGRATGKTSKKAVKNGPTGPFFMTGLFINVSVSVYGFFVFLPGNHHKVFPTQLIGFFRQIASGVHR